MVNRLVIGYFGYRSNRLDGQTVKTRNFFSLLKELDGKTKFFDTEDIKASKINVFKLMLLVLAADKIYYLPAHNSLKRFFPILFKISKSLRKKIYYFMVGGWLTNFLRENTDLKNNLGKIEMIFCETFTIRRELSTEFGFTNLSYFPNFRDVTFRPKFQHCNHDNIKIVYLGRINKGKGILDIISTAKLLLDNGINNFSIDLYGQISADFLGEFTNSLALVDVVNFRGPLEPEMIYEKLQNYDLMLFPTRFYTEGLPGTILDAYLSGIPVLASEWKHAAEFIDNNETGIVFKFEDQKEFYQSLVQILKAPSILEKMKVKAYEKSKSFTKGSAKAILKEIL